MNKGPNRRHRTQAKRVELGQHIVADPAICHGRVTFKGTRIFVADVLADVASGLSWEFIIRRWGGGKLSKDAIAEALQFSIISQFCLDYNLPLDKTNTSRRGTFAVA